jgi:hypothetical protein
LNRSFRWLFHRARGEVSKKFPELATSTVVGGFLFLRFFCPAIVTPEAFGLLESMFCYLLASLLKHRHFVAEPPPAETRRGLVLVSKLLQNLANAIIDPTAKGSEEMGSGDGDRANKESYMAQTHQFVANNSEMLRTFFNFLAVCDKFVLGIHAHCMQDFAEDGMETANFPKGEQNWLACEEETSCILRYLAAYQDKVTEFLEKKVFYNVWPA